MKKNIFQTTFIVDKISTLKDRSIKVTLETQELPQEQMAVLFSFANSQIWGAFCDMGIVEEDIKIEENLEFPNQKSLSQRLYNALFVLYQKKGGKPEEFENFRQVKMTNIIEQVKKMISDYE